MLKIPLRKINKFMTDDERSAPFEEIKSAGGEWIEQVSYPEAGNDIYFPVEDGSWWFNHRNRCVKEAVKPIKENEDFYDVGGGNGFVSSMLQNELGFNVFLVEPGSVGSKNARSRGIKNVLCSTFENLIVKENSLANIGLFDVLEHIEGDLNYLQHIHKKLRSGEGRLYLTVPAFSWLWSKEDEFVGHFRRYTLKILSKLVESAGFQVEYASYFFSVLPPAIFLKRSLAKGKEVVYQDLAQVRENVKADQLRKIPYIAQKIFSWEVATIKAGGRIPWGSSILMRARKL